MNILLIHQYFNTPEQGGPLRSYYLAQGMLEHGHSVTVLTAHNGVGHKQVMLDGLTVHYLPVFYENQLGFIRRVWAFLKFLVLASRKTPQLGRFDLCYAISTPLTVGAIALRVKRKLSLPYYFEVGDLWPEAPIQMGVLKNAWLISFLRSFERRVYAGAEKVIALSPAIKQGVLQSCPQAQVEVLPNMSDCVFFQPGKKAATSKMFTIFYFGAAGKANHLSYLIDVAQMAPAGVRFLIAAKGSELPQLKKQAQNLSNVEFLPYLNRAEFKAYLDQADAVYVSYAKLPVLTTGSPHKFFDGIAAGKLMILNFGG